MNEDLLIRPVTYSLKLFLGIFVQIHRGQDNDRNPAGGGNLFELMGDVKP